MTKFKNLSLVGKSDLEIKKIMLPVKEWEFNKANPLYEFSLDNMFLTNNDNKFWVEDPITFIDKIILILSQAGRGELVLSPREPSSNNNFFPLMIIGFFENLQVALITLDYEETPRGEQPILVTPRTKDKTKNRFYFGREDSPYPIFERNLIHIDQAIPVAEQYLKEGTRSTNLGWDSHSIDELALLTNEDNDEE